MTATRRVRAGSDPRQILRAAAAAVAVGVAVLGSAAPLIGGPIGTLGADQAGALPADVTVLDIRDEDSCVDGALANTRCFPADQLLSGDHGAPISFHALRWALGALGLTGAETLVVYADPQAPRDDALAAAALLHLAGQAEVLVFTGEAGRFDDSGETRAPWRQAIYTAPMRIAAMEMSAAPGGDLVQRLKDYATDGGVVAFASGH